MFTIDGIQWDVPCTIERVSEVKASQISGMMLNKTYFNDVLGTWLKYTISIAVPLNRIGMYTALYEILTQPIDGHSFVLPYNEQNVQVTGRIEVVSDRWVMMEDDHNYWRATKFEVIANHPSKKMELDEVIYVGMTPIPTVQSPAIGDMYEFTENGWEQLFFVNADEVSY